MRSQILLEENIVHGSGIGPAVPVSLFRGKLLVLTLGITRAIAYESVEVFVCGSYDGEHWSLRPLAAYPRKSYCGLYSMPLNLVAHPDVPYVRAQWLVEHWGRRDSEPLFGLYFYLEESGARCVSRRPTAMAANS